MARFKEVSQTEFNKFIEDYPRKLKTRDYGYVDNDFGDRREVHYYDDSIKPDEKMAWQEIVARKAKNNSKFMIINE